MIKKLHKTEAEWREILTPEQYLILRGKGTEAPFSCAWDVSRQKNGVYHCAACDLPLFRTEAMFDSGTKQGHHGWPSYFAPVNPGHVEERPDNSFGMRRTEVLCARCGSHLGHVFPGSPAIQTGDPPPTEKRYCINSVALNYKGKSNEK